MMSYLAQLDDLPRSKRPSDRAIAFAISVVLSKPDDLLIQDYIAHLRQHIAKGRREGAISTSHRHLDRSSYWRAEYERSKDALRKSERERFDLQRQVEALKRRLEEMEGPGRPIKRRKKIDEGVTTVQRSPKRAGDRCSAVTDVWRECDINFAISSNRGSLLVGSLYRVQTALRNDHRMDTNALAYHLVSAANELPAILKEAVSISHESSDSSVLKSTFSASARAFAMLIAGITRLSNEHGVAASQGWVVYAYVRMFSRLLDILQYIPGAEVERKIAAAKPATKSRRSLRSKGREKAQQQAEQSRMTEVPSLNAMTSFLCRAIDLLDANSGAHMQLFEGFAYCVLSLLGSRLYTCVFGRSRENSIEEEILASKGNKDNIEDPPEGGTTEIDSIDLLKLRIEAPYLIQLLKRLMAAAPSQFGRGSVTETGRDKRTCAKTASEASLVTHAREKLQRTLISCIFGTEGLDRNDPLLDGLEMPGTPEKPLSTPTTEESQGIEWFKEEMWRLVGWDILGTSDSTMNIGPSREP